MREKMEVAALQVKGQFSVWERCQVEFLNRYNCKWKKEQSMNFLATSSLFLLLFLLIGFPLSSHMETAMMY